MPTIDQIQDFGQLRTDSKAANAQRDMMVERILAEIESGTAPWMKPWSSEALAAMQPHNAVSNKTYRGVNLFWLMLIQESMQTTDGRWMTFKQAKDNGYSVKKGHKGVQVIYASRFEIKDEEGNRVLDDKGFPIWRSFAKTATVFHASDIDGIPEIEEREPVDVAPITESLIANSKVRLIDSIRDEANYSPLFDVISMPTRAAYEKPEEYTSTLLHEMSHWTGHHTRLDRHEKEIRFGSVDYAKEELIAEMGAFFTAMTLGLSHVPGNTAAYLESWSKVVKRSEDREIGSVIRDAMFQAGQASEMLVDFANGKVAETEEAEEAVETETKSLAMA